jgi:hypothetical protein
MKCGTNMMTFLKGLLCDGRHVAGVGVIGRDHAVGRGGEVLCLLLMQQGVKTVAWCLFYDTFNRNFWQE